MTVAELIEELQHYEKHLTVIIPGLTAYRESCDKEAKSVRLVNQYVDFDYAKVHGEFLSIDGW